MPHTIEEVNRSLDQQAAVIKNLYNTLHFTVDHLKQYLISVHEDHKLHMQAGGYSVI